MDIMFDLETMSSSNRSAIIAIGAVAFDPSTDKLDKEFYTNISLESCLKYRLEVSGSTIRWWMNQSQEARDALYSPEPVGLDDALKAFASFFDSIGPRKTTRIWAYATFDPPILSYAYEACGRYQPYSYSLIRDVRTVYDLAYPYPQLVPIANNNDKHNALSDAKHQALGVQQCYKKLFNL